MSGTRPGITSLVPNQVADGPEAAESLALVKAFREITDATVRKKIIMLVEKAASGEFKFQDE